MVFFFSSPIVTCLILLFINHTVLPTGIELSMFELRGWLTSLAITILHANYGVSMTLFAMRETYDWYLN